MEYEGPFKCGYLFKYRPYKMGMFSNTWELRFFSISGQILQYYKSEKEKDSPPRGLLKTEGCIVEVEGKKKDRFWTFSVVDPSGLNLLRMSSESEAVANDWIQVLESAGCTRRYLSRSYRTRSPLRSADIRYGVDHGSERILQYRKCHRCCAKAGQESKGLKRVPSHSNSLHHRWEDSVGEATSATTDDGDSHPASDKGLQQRPSGNQRDYASDSGMSDGGRSTVSASGGAMPKSMTKRRSELRGSTNLYTDVRPSMLSAERIALTQHSGILNLMVLVLLATNFRLILENLLKYGILTHPTRWILFLVTDSNISLFLCWPVMAMQACLALGIEKTGAQQLKLEEKAGTAKRKKDHSPADSRRRSKAMRNATEGLLGLLNVLNTTAVIAVPAAVIHITLAEPVPSFTVIIVATVLWMKLVSFAHCNYDLREMQRQKMWKLLSDSRERSKTRRDESAESMQIPETIPQGVEVRPGKDVRYPDNLTFANLAYFLVAPTLCYQTSYPTSSRFRPKFVLWYVLRLLAVMGVGLIITEQYIEPTIANSIVPLAELNWARIAERVLKLSLPTLYGWIIMFYALFHVWLNILAELTYFGDREFYKDWWNATTIGDYWRLWNVPVHKWLLRHVYYPAIRLKVPKTAAACAVFFVSAVFHELLVGVPLHMVRLWAFSGLMFQVPLLFATEYIKSKAKSDTIGNFVFWFSFVIYGQPMAVMLYYHDYALLHRPEWLAALKAKSCKGDL